jgi:hypothetical protein
MGLGSTERRCRRPAGQPVSGYEGQIYSLKPTAAYAASPATSSGGAQARTSGQLVYLLNEDFFKGGLTNEGFRSDRKAPAA